jgi:hypothetical protein
MKATIYFICFRLAAPPLLSHRAMHALNGNIDHPQQIDINAFPAQPFLPVVIEKITAPRKHTPTPSSTTIADFENELAKTNPDSAASLQRDVITPNKKSKKKNKNKKKIAPPPSDANANVVHFNMNLGGVESAIHFLRKFSKRYANKTLIVNLVETGLQTTEETKSLTTFAAEIGFSCSHVLLSAEESNLIWKLRKMKNNKPVDKPKTPRRGGISTFWNAPLKDPIICKDENKHWQSLTFAHNGHVLKVIALYNNNSAAVSPHPYDAQTGDEIIANDIAPLITKHTIVLADANQTKNDKTHRNPAKPSHKPNALNGLLSKSDLTDAIAHINPEPQFTYTKSHANGLVSSVIDYILVPQTFVDEHRIYDGGLTPTNYRPALDVAPTAPLQTPSHDPAFDKYDPYSPHLPIFASLSLPLIPSGFTLPEMDPDTEVRPNQPKNDEEQTRFLALLNDRVLADPMLARLVLPKVTRAVILASNDHLEQAELLQRILPLDIDCEPANARFESIYLDTLIETCGVKRKMQSFHHKIHHDPKFYHLKIVKERALIALRNLKAHLRTDAPAGPFPSHSIANLKASTLTMLDVTKLPLPGWLDAPAFKSNNPIDLVMVVKALKNRASNAAAKYLREVKQTKHQQRVQENIDAKCPDTKLLWKNIRTHLANAEDHPKPNGIFKLDANNKKIGETITNKDEALTEVERQWTRVCTPTVADISMQIPTDPTERDAFLLKHPFLAPDPDPALPPPDLTARTCTLISRIELDDALSNTASDKATGTNHQRANEIKAADETLDVVLSLLNLSIVQKKQPTTWATANVVLLHKKDAPENAMNYRPIALLQTLYKVLTSVLNRRLVAILESTSAISPLQAGFLRNRGTTEQIAEHLATLSNANIHKKQLHITYIDLQKAFDTVPLAGIQHALTSFHVPEPLQEMIRNCYANASSRFTTPWGVTGTVPIKMGVRQGDPLSPTLFIVWMNLFLSWASRHHNARPYQWENSPNRLKALMLAYADDLVFYSSTLDDMRQTLALFERFLDFYGFRVGHDKCAQQSIHSRGQPPPLLIQGKPIPYLLPSAAYRYLGCLVTPDLNWNVQRESTLRKCKQKLDLLSVTRYPARLKAQIINRAIWPLVTSNAMVIFTDTLLEKLMRKAQKVLRSAFHASNHLGTESLYAPVADGGIGLQNLLLESSIRAIEVTRTLLNANIPTGTVAVRESLGAALGLPGFSTDHRKSHLVYGPFEFSYKHAGEDDNHPQYSAWANKHFPYKRLKEAIATVRKLTSSNLSVIWLDACAPTLPNVLGLAALSDPTLAPTASDKPPERK